MTTRRYQMKTIIHRADSRGTAEYGWLHSRHTFSFASYYDPNRMGFGKLRVINDDIVEAGAGFGTHPHENMEIISIPLSGGLWHQDSMGNQHTINTGDIQIMSAGTGLSHSEYNASNSKQVNFLQIWVLPKFKNIKPRYDQKTFHPANRMNKFELVVSPNKEDDAVWINQDTWFSLGDFDANTTAYYDLKQTNNGIYIFLLKGNISIADKILKTRDAIGITEVNKIDIHINQDSELLVIEVPIKD